MTFAWSMAVGLMLGGTTRFTGFVMVAMAAAIAWGRIYVGVHWPFDMAGGGGGAGRALLYGQRVTALLERLGDSVHAAVMGRRHAP